MCTTKIRIWAFSGSLKIINYIFPKAVIQFKKKKKKKKKKNSLNAKETRFKRNVMIHRTILTSHDLSSKQTLVNNSYPTDDIFWEI